MAEAQIGFWEAITKYEEKHGVKLCTFAYIRIKGKLSDLLEKFHTDDISLRVEREEKEDESYVIDPMCDWVDEADASYLDKELKSRLSQKIASLPENQRKMFLAVHNLDTYEKLNIEEAGQGLQLTPKQAYKNYEKAKQAIIAFLRTKK